jgi:N4-gp56 family major capsid protein
MSAVWPNDTGPSSGGTLPRRRDRTRRGEAETFTLKACPMSTTNYSVNAPEAVKLWRSQLAREALKATWIQKFIGETSEAIIQVFGETGKSAGDRVTVTLRMQLNGDGVAGDGTLEGNEEPLTTYTDNLFVDQLRHAVRSGGKMTEQRIPWSIREESLMGLKDWWAGRLDTAFFNQVCGYTPATDVKFTGMNGVIAPDAQHITRPNAKATDQALAAGDEMSLALIDKLVESAKLGSTTGVGPVIRPINVDGDLRYVVVLHTRQVTQLRAAVGAGSWLDIQKAAMTGDGSNNNPIMTGALGMYNGAVLHESTRVTNGVDSGTGAPVLTARRAVLMGAQACAIGFGQNQSFKSFDWNEELFDYGNQLGVEAGLIHGLKKLRFNNLDFGTIVGSTFTT